MGKDGIEVGGEETLPAQVAPPRPPLLLRILVSGTVSGMGLIAFLYLLNPGLGWAELLPDNLPLLGNLDEAGATALLLMVCSYWGLDVTALGRGLGRWSKPAALPPGDGDAA